MSMGCAMVRMDFSSRLAAIVVTIVAAATPALSDALVLDVRRVSPDRVIPGEPVYVEMTLRNEGHEPIVLPYVPFDSEIGWDITRGGTRPRYLGGSAPDRYKCELVSLLPGKSVTRTYNLSDRFDLSAEGVYTAIASYSSIQNCPSQESGASAWTGKILARSLTFVIDPLPPGEESAYCALKGIRNIGWGNTLCQEFKKTYPSSRFTPYLLYWMAEAALSQERPPAYEKARTILRELATKYPNFPVSELSAQRLQECEQALGQRPEVTPKQ